MVSLGLKPVSLAEFKRILYGDPVRIDEEAVSRIRENFSFLQEFSRDKLIYGINTGFGPMAQYKIAPENLLQLQYNLIRSHASGSGRLLPEQQSRAVLIARLVSLLQGYSGIHEELIHVMTSMLNHGISPCIYEHGGVGASGDLVQLAHLALALIGEGEVWSEGKPQSAASALKKAGLAPLKVHVREGLALLNGTSAMTGIGLINVLHARQLLEWSVLLSSMTNELMEAFDDHYSEGLNAVKHHAGQSQVADMMCRVLEGSGMIRKRHEHLYHPANLDQEVFEEKVQEYYSLRCVPQVLGPVADTILQAQRVLTDELNSVNDNPVIDHKRGNVYHGGNFHGDYVALEMDKLRISITKLSMLAERQLNYLLNEKLNRKFPPFVNLGTLGLNFGMQGVQFTAVSTVAENQTLSFPMYVHSIPNNNDNQDIVSMGANAALLTARVIGNSFEVLAIQAMAIMQAVDFLGNAARMAPVTKQLHTAIRKIFPVFVEDSPRFPEVRAVREFLEQHHAAITLEA